ncbi:MAG: glycine--tRNA ligase [Ruminococcaceae bacterium]|nr:glycine--tRNA ligase [Oscillospiraceae bacterium]MBO4972504.1 glycine--tRNA ligase [Clostridia bacterium]
MDNRAKTMDKIVALCKNRGFIFPGSEIYGGLANSWDYGPLGVEFKNNVKKAWWKKFVQENKYNVGLDCAIIMNPETWVASGHVGGFSDPLMDCKACKTRHRADKLIEDYAAENNLDVNPAGWSNAEMAEYIAKEGIKCPSCGSDDFTDIRKFNLMFKTYQGVTEDSTSELYLRPETAQGIFVNFKNVARTTRKKMPFGVCQIGKSFRNEITPGNFIFRTREFEQMELEFFCRPGTDLDWFKYWKDYCEQFLYSLGMKPENLRLRDHSPEELCFYSKATTDFEFLFPFGWGELWGIADRTDYDLTQHANHSGESMEFFDPETNEKYVPYVVEPSLGADRVALAFLVDAYDEEVVDEAKNDTRVVLHLHPALAPVKAAVLPLSKKLADQAGEVFEQLAKYFNVEYDESGSIGKRYRRQDEIGTPFCITYDFESENDGCVTVRDRDTMEQVRLPITELRAYLEKALEF